LIGIEEKSGEKNPQGEGKKLLNKSLFSSDSQEWETPQELFDELDKEFHFNLDPCASHGNAKCKVYFTQQEDGLKQDWWYWVGDEKRYYRVFVNPPYGREVGKWVKKAYEESQGGCTVVCLLAARTDTRWFHDYCLRGEIRWIKGRLKFGGAKNSAPFPSMIVIFRFFAEPDIKIKPLSRKEFLRKWKDSPNIFEESK